MALSHMMLASLLAVSMQYTDEVSSAARSGPVASQIESTSPVAILTGQPAPDFVFRSHEYGWRRLRDVLEQGSVLLVFGGSDEQLRSVQGSYRPLLEAGVVPMVVTTLGSDDARRAIERCEVAYSLLSDPHDEIAAQFGIPATEFEGWYLIDAKGRVRGHGMGAVPHHGWASLTTVALSDGDTQALGDK